MTNRQGRWRLAVDATAATLLLGLIALGVRHSSASPGVVVRHLAATLAVAQPGPELHRDRIEGHRQCVDCHRSEYRVWSQSPHALGAFDKLRISPAAKTYCQKMGIDPALVTSPDSRCVKCHATLRTLPGGAADVLAGVSCEACHNGSGGPKGWLNPHAVYGPSGTRREDETRDHFEFRHRIQEEAGQYASGQLYDLTRRCMECHLVPDEELVNIGGHKGPDRVDFKFQERASGDKIRHNFHLDQQQNAPVSSLWLHPQFGPANRTPDGRKRVMVVLGQLARLEVGLRSLANAKDPDREYFGSMLEIVIDAYEELEDMIDDVEDEDGQMPIVKQLLEQLEEVYEKVDDDDVDPEQDRPELLAAADQVAAAGRKFAQRDGSGLEGIDID